MLHLITGGSGSGKSAYAEQCILDFGALPRIYIATMYPFDEESHRRIARHREMRREKQFSTVECFSRGRRGGAGRVEARRGDARRGGAR